MAAKLVTRIICRTEEGYMHNDYPHDKYTVELVEGSGMVEVLTKDGELCSAFSPAAWCAVHVRRVEE